MVMTLEGTCAKDAAWPSIGWETFFSFEYSCIAPMMRLVPARKGVQHAPLSRLQPSPNGWMKAR